MTSLKSKLCEELKALAGNKVLQVLKFTFRIDGCESKALVENAFRNLAEVLMDPGWSALVYVAIDIVVACCHQEVAGLELNLVPDMYLGCLSCRKILFYKCAHFVYNSVE